MTFSAAKEETDTNIIACNGNKHNSHISQKNK